MPFFDCREFNCLIYSGLLNLQKGCSRKLKFLRVAHFSNFVLTNGSESAINKQKQKNMNHLLHQITWHQYLSATIVIAIIYYLAVILRCYRPELQNLQKRITGDKKENQLQALQYQPAEEEVQPAPIQSQAKYTLQQESISESDILAGQLKACIAKAADKSFAPAILIPQLKQILQEHTELAVAERPFISHLIVAECERTGTALLTEEEVDQWWER